MIVAALLQGITKGRHAFLRKELTTYFVVSQDLAYKNPDDSEAVRLESVKNLQSTLDGTLCDYRHGRKGLYGNPSRHVSGE